MSNLNDRNRFQIISYETNNSAFFSNAVVLVEGDSDLVLVPHIARTLNPKWDSDTAGISFCRVGGKGNIAKYREFFEAFGVKVSVITDLDCLLDGFDLLEASKECSNLRQKLLHLLDEIVQNENVEATVGARDIRVMQSSQQRHNQFQVLIETIDKYKKGEATNEEVRNAEDQFFANVVADKRYQVLGDLKRPTIVEAKQKLIACLRQQNIHVLERGRIEDYYPSSIQTADKPSMATQFCRQVTDREALLALCGDTIWPGGPKADKEFTVLFASIFANEVP